MAIQLTVARDNDERRGTVDHRLRHPRHQPVAHERIRVDRRDRFEGHGCRK
jgi:hypothetical protein